MNNMLNAHIMNNIQITQPFTHTSTDISHIVNVTFTSLLMEVPSFLKLFYSPIKP
jgi:hypothetical protein